MARRTKRQYPGENESPLRRLRENAELTQEQLAVYVGVAVSSIRRWEKGDEPTLTLSQMRAFCRAVKVEFNELPERLSVATSVVESSIGEEAKPSEPKGLDNSSGDLSSDESETKN
jgi:transcriptional regulator with XRE-family HTH domain